MNPEPLTDDTDMAHLLEAMRDDAEPETQESEAPPSVAVLGQELRDLKADITEAEGRVSDLKARKKQIATNLLPDAMAEAGLVGANGKGGFTLAEGGRVHLRQETYVSCPKAKQADLHTWLEANGHGALIRPTVHSQTLKAWVKEQRGQGSEIPEHLLSIFDETVAVAVGS